MIDYPDTSFLFSYYLAQSNSQAAAEYAEQASQPLQITELLRYEFRQSLRFQAWRRAANPREGIKLQDAQAAMKQLEQDLRTGVAQLVPCSTREVIAKADELSDQFTIRGGHRTLDLLHVATAIVLNAERLLTFDKNQRALALVAGLKVGP